MSFTWGTTHLQKETIVTHGSHTHIAFDLACCLSLDTCSTSSQMLFWTSQLQDEMSCPLAIGAVGPIWISFVIFVPSNMENLSNKHHTTSSLLFTYSHTQIQNDKLQQVRCQDIWDPACAKRPTSGLSASNKLWNHTNSPGWNEGRFERSAQHYNYLS